MSGSIYVLDDKNKITELKESKYDNEDIFQELIEKYPNILAGDQINPENPRKWIFISREIGIPDGEDSSNRWYLDHLFIDQDAIPTFVEVKRSTDTRIRREVVGQMLDYAANATNYWKIDDIRNLYENQERNIYDDLEIEEDNEDLFWKNVENNLKLGKIRLLFVADEIPFDLRRIIEFLNEQMNNTEVLGIEIKQFTSDSKLKTFVPRVVGLTTDSIQLKKNSEKREWTEEEILQEVENLDHDLVKVCKEIIDKFQECGCRIYWGEGNVTPSFTPIYDGKQRNQLFVIFVYKSGIRIQIYFKHYKEPFFNINKKKEIQEFLNDKLGLKIEDTQLDKNISFSLDLLKDNDKYKLFIEYYINLVNDIKKSKGN